MPNVRTEVASYLNTVLPGQIGPGRRWDDAFVTLLINMADTEIREYCSPSWGAQTISLVSGTAEYDIDDTAISIYRVEYSADGTTFDDTLMPMEMYDLDGISRKWRDDTSARPSRYVVHSTPGVPVIGVLTSSKITVYPEPTSSAADLKVTYTSLYYGLGTPQATRYAIDNVYAPLVMAMLTLGDSASKGGRHYGRYLEGRERLRAMADEYYSETEQSMSDLSVPHDIRGI